MSQPPSLPISPPPSVPKPGFSWRNWGRNGWTSRITVFITILMILNLFQPWEVDFSSSDYSTHETSGSYRITTWHQGASYTAKTTAFDQHQGWIPFLLLLATLYVCGVPRQQWQASRWIPLLAGIIIFAIVFDAIRDLDRETESWTAHLGSKPYVKNPPAMQWVMLFSVPLMICGMLLAKKPAAKIGGDVLPG